MAPETKTFLASPKTMGAILAASRGGRSKEQRETVRRRCLAQRAAMGEIWAKELAADAIGEERTNRA